MPVSIIPGRSYLANSEQALPSFDTIGKIDRVVVDSSELTVKDLRLLLTRVSQTPFGTTRLLVFTSADLLSPILQTTLLKLVEEPPSFLIVVLQSSRPESLLSTLRSRLHYIETAGVANREATAAPDLTSLLLKNRTEALTLLGQLRRYLVGSNPINLKRLQYTDQAIKKLERNCNVKLTLDHFLLQSEALSGME